MATGCATRPFLLLFRDDSPCETSLLCVTCLWPYSRQGRVPNPAWYRKLLQVQVQVRSIDRRLDRHGTRAGRRAAADREKSPFFQVREPGRRPFDRAAQMTPAITEFSRVYYKRKQSATVSSYASLAPYANSEESFCFCISLSFIFFKARCLF